MASWWVHHTCLQLMLVENFFRVIEALVAVFLAGRRSPGLVIHVRWCHGCARAYGWSSLILAFGVVGALLATKRGVHPRNSLRYRLL